MPRKHGLGGPWVTVRAHYGALPSVAGRGWSERAKALGIMAKASPRPGRTVPGSKKSPQVERREALPCALFPPGNMPRRVTLRLSALRFPSQRGGKLKAHLAWATRERRRTA